MGGGLSTTGLCFFGQLGFSNPCVSRSWFDADFDMTPDCNLDNPQANDECGQIDNLQFGSNQLVGANFDPGLFSGWSVRPSDWSFGASIQQEIFPRASVEVGYYRRWFTQYFTGGTVTDNLAISPNDVAAYSIRVPNDSRLPNGGDTISGLYDVNPNVFGQVNNLIKSTKDVGDDTRVFNGVDVNINVRGAHGFTFQGGTSTGKVTDDWCEIRAAVPESYLLNPYCHNESPFLTSFRALATYTIPKIDVNLSTVFQDKPNIGTDQIASLPATYTLTTPATAPAGTVSDTALAAAQIGRPLTGNGAAGEPPGAGSVVRRADSAEGSRGEEDHPLQQPAADARRGLLQPDEQQRDARVQQRVRPEHSGVGFPDLVHEPARHASERRVQLVAAPAAGWSHP